MAKFNSERFIRDTCRALDIEVLGTFRAGSFDFPEGWKLVVDSLLEAMRGCKVQIFSIRNDHGLLDVRAVAEPASELKVYRAIVVFQKWASITCDSCGARGIKMVLGGRVRVLCQGCMDKNKED